MLFRELNLSDEIKKAVEKIGFSEMTAIQEQAIPIMLTGIDLIGKSQTGTGKTLAFSIPAIEKVKNNIKNGLTVLILCPTRELVTQVHEELKKLTYFLPDIKSTPIYGGVSIEPQILKLKTSNIVIGTPGRVIDHIKRNTLKLQNINLVILDEADEMLDMGFRDDIETILDNTPKEKQVVLFSATMPPEILAVTKKYQKNPKIIEINRKHLAVENIKQIYYNVPLNQKMVALNMLLKYHDPKLVIIFCNTKKCVDELNLYLYKNKFNSKALHGDMNQVQRQKMHVQIQHLIHHLHNNVQQVFHFQVFFLYFLPQPLRRQMHIHQIPLWPNTTYVRHHHIQNQESLLYFFLYYNNSLKKIL